MPHRTRIALCHPSLDTGRSRAAVLWAITALRDEYDLTLVTASKVDLGKLNATFGTDVAAGDFHLRRAHELPAANGSAKIGHSRVKRFEQFCRANTDETDIPLSVYNPIDFGRPGVHLVGDFSWDDETRTELFEGSGEPPLWLGSRLFGTSGRDILNGHDLVVANSEATAAVLAERFRVQNVPVLAAPQRDARDRPDEFVEQLPRVIARFVRRALAERAA